MVLAFVAAVGVGWVARGATLHTADASPAVAREPSCPNPEVVAIAAAVLTPDPPAANEDADAPTPDPDDESSGDDVGDILARANAATETHNGVHGVVTDQTSGALLRGVTVLLVQPGGGAQTATTNEEGEYAFADLEAGTYTVSFYYVNAVSQHPNVTINSFDSVTLSDRLDIREDDSDRDDDVEYVFEME